MDQRTEFEKTLARLKDLDNQLNDNPDASGAMEELNDILNGLSRTMQFDVTTKPPKTLNYVNTSNNPDPCFAQEGDSGFDLRAYLQDNIEYHVEPWKGVIVPTGLYVEVEKGLEVQVRPRSGLAAKYWVTVLNTPGTVDSRYRGEIQIIFINLSDEKFVIKNGDRIAQGVVCPVYGEGFLKFNKVEKLSESTRGANGFGSTGVK